MKQVIIVIPIYCDMSHTERISLERCISVLGRYPINLLHPVSYSVAPIIEQYGSQADISETAMDDRHFKSVQTYSDLLLSTFFYDCYADYEFMLICQLDAYVFRDELQQWLDSGYDYVGAPWIPTEYYWKRTYGMLHQRIRRLFPVDVCHIPHCFKYFAVGNGGFSLRNIQKIRQVVADDREIIDRCHYYEDWYISQVATRTHDIRIPDWRTALRFSFEQSLSHCYALNNRQLPFGCHYWNSPKKYKRFWHRFIQT